MSNTGDVLRLRENLADKFGERELRPQRFQATMGDGTGAVSVPGKPNYVYVRRVGRGLIEECLNNKAAARDGLPVIAGYSHESPEILQILEVDWPSFTAPGNYSYVQHHHEAHELNNTSGGDDVVWVQSQQFMPLLVYPTSPATMFVNVFGGWYPWLGGWHYFDPALSADLTAHIPLIAGEARYVLISIDGATEALQYTAGATFPMFLPPVDAENMLPAPPAGSIPIAGVYLPFGTASLDWDNLYDIRLFNQPVGGSVTPAAHALLDSTVHSDTVTNAPLEGSLVIGNATPDWDRLVHPGAANRVLQSTAAGVGWSAQTLVLTTALTNQGAAGVLNWGGAFTLTIPATGTAVIGGGVGAANRVAYWTDANTLASDVGLFVDAANDLYLVADAGGIGNNVATARLYFDSSAATDYAYFMGCNVGVGYATPEYSLEIRSYTGADITHADTASKFMVVYDPTNAMAGPQQVGSIWVEQDYLDQVITLNALLTSSLLFGRQNVSAQIAGTTKPKLIGSYQEMYAHATSSGTLESYTCFYAGGWLYKHAASTLVVDTQYGLYVGSLSTATTNWAVYTAGTTPSYFGGDVGIGTVGPDEKLHVEGNILLDAYNLGAGSGIFFREGFSSGDANPYNLSMTVRGWGTPASPDGFLISGFDGIGFMTGTGTYVAANVRMLIEPGGNVGIGTVTPGSLMEWNFATENLEFVNAGSVAATEQDWIEVQVGNVTGYIRVFAAK